MLTAVTSGEKAVSAVVIPTASYGGVDGYSPALVARFQAAAEARSAAAAAAAAASGGGIGSGAAVPNLQSEVTTSSV